MVLKSRFLNTETKALTLLLGMLLGLVSASIDSTVPALPAIQASFSASAGEVQMVLSGIMMGFVTGQITAGPLADRFGRRPMLIAALSVFCAAAFACAVSESLPVLCLARFAQGCAAVFGPVLARAIVRDLHADEAAARLMGRVTLAFAVMPILMPLLGGQLVGWAGWRAVFWMQTAFALLLLAAVVSRLPETSPPNRQSIALRSILHNYAFLLGQKKFLAPTALGLFSSMGVFAFVTNSALVVIPVLGLTPREYSLLFALVMIGYLSGARVGMRNVMRRGIPRMLTLASVAAAAGGMLMAALALAGMQSAAAIGIPMAIFMFSNGMLSPSTSAAALSPFPQLAGMASSLQAIIQLVGGTALGLALSFSFNGTTLPLAGAMGICGLAQLCLERYYTRRRAFAPAPT